MGGSVKGYLDKLKSVISITFDQRSAGVICGSGPHTRDEDVFSHRIFLAPADALNRRGVAVLRHDKRGVGDSSGDFATATSPDFAAEAEKAGTGSEWFARSSDSFQREPGFDAQGVERQPGCDDDGISECESYCFRRQRAVLLKSTDGLRRRFHRRL